jgi:hypothetical protein
MTQSYLDRVPSPNGSAESAGDASPGEWLGLYPALSEFLVASRWSNGDARLPGTLTLFSDGPVWKMCLSDRAQSRVAFVSGSSPQGAFQAAEEGLQRSSLDWRPQRPSKGRRS